MQWILCDMERNTDLIVQTSIQTTEKGTTTTEIDTVLHDIGIKLRWGILESPDSILVPP